MSHCGTSQHGGSCRRSASGCSRRPPIRLHTHTRAPQERQPPRSARARHTQRGRSHTRRSLPPTRALHTRRRHDRCTGRDPSTQHTQTHRNSCRRRSSTSLGTRAHRSRCRASRAHSGRLPVPFSRRAKQRSPIRIRRDRSSCSSRRAGHNPSQTSPGSTRKRHPHRSVRGLSSRSHRFVSSNRSCGSLLRTRSDHRRSRRARSRAGRRPAA
mmetsp:Transcript_48896/g.127685  ORF Transcript_48896/g.127685 Transcript_48896/m.127685 type:complete len:212 (+) Transcript_48896:686-1321(+)